MLMISPENAFSADPRRCTHCGLCVRECVNDVLEMGEDSFPRVRQDGMTRCNHCQHCFTVCPSGAFRMDGLDPDSAEKVSPPAQTLFPDLLNLVRCRRSIRHYRRENVPQEALREILQALKDVPTGVNYGHLAFTVVDDLAQMDRVREHVYKVLRSACTARPQDPALQRLAPCAERYFSEGRDIVFRTAPHLILAGSPADAPCGDVDPLIALSCFEMLANARGIGTVWCGRLITLFKAVPELRNFLQLPGNAEIRYAMLFGLPEWRHARCADRKEVLVRRFRFPEN